MVRNLVLLISLLFWSSSLHAQLGSVRQKTIPATKNEYIFDSLSVLPGTVRVMCGTSILAETDYSIN